MISLGLASLIGGIVSGLASTGAAIYGSAKNYQSQKETNAANIQMQRETNANALQISREANAQQLDLAKNAHQYEMADLQAAGLNPVLTATGGSGAPMTTLHTPNQQAPQAKAPMIDTAGIASSLNAISHMMAMGMLADQQTKNRGSREMIAGNRDKVLSGLYRRKAEYLGSREESKGLINSSNQVRQAAKKQKWTKANEKEWQRLMKELDGYNDKE